MGPGIPVEWFVAGTSLMLAHTSMGHYPWRKVELQVVWCLQTATGSAAHTLRIVSHHPLTTTVACICIGERVGGTILGVRGTRFRAAIFREWVAHLDKKKFQLRV